MAHLYDLPAIYRDELLSSSVGSIIPLVQMTANNKYAVTFNADGSITFSDDYARVFWETVMHLSDAPITISLSKTILPDDGNTENIITANEVELAFNNPQGYFAAIQEGAIFDPSNIEQIDVWILASLNGSGFPYPLYRGRVSGLPAEEFGKTIFTVRSEMFDAVTRPVLFEKFGPGQFARADGGSLSIGTETVTPATGTGGFIAYPGIIYFDEQGNAFPYLDNESVGEVRINEIVVNNQALTGRYQIEFTDNDNFKIRYPNNSQISGNVFEDFPLLSSDNQTIQIKPDGWDISPAIAKIIVRDDNHIGASSVSIQVQTPTGIIDLYVTTTLLGINSWAFNINLATPSHGFTARVENYGFAGFGTGELIITAPRVLGENANQFLLNANITGTPSVGEDFAWVYDTIDFSGQGEPRGAVIEFNVQHVVQGNPVRIAMNLIEKGLLQNWGSAPTYPASLPVNWDAFEAAAAKYEGFTVWVDITNDDNEVWQQRFGNKPINCLRAAQNVLDHIGCQITITDNGFIGLNTPDITGQRLYTLSDAGNQPAIINHKILAQDRDNFIKFQFGRNLKGGNYGRTIEKDLRTVSTAQIKERAVNLPFFKNPVSFFNVDATANGYISRILQTNTRIALTIKPNWGLSLVPGDRFRLTTTTPPVLDFFVEVYKVSKLIGGEVQVEVVKILDVPTDPPDTDYQTFCETTFCDTFKCS